MLQDLTDDILLFDECDDTHGTGALGAEQRIDFVNLLYQAGPGAAGGPGFDGVIFYRRRFSGKPSSRYCCGNGLFEDPEGDGAICDCNF